MMKNMMVTGGCGFIGANFIRYLLEESDFSGRIINLDKLTYAGNPESLADIQERFPDQYVFIKADICDMDLMKTIFSQFDLDSVCHFAAESHVDRSIVSPGAFIQTNIVGTFNLLEAARSIGDRLLLFHHISTDEVFGSLGEDGFFSETTLYRPNSPYSASKAASDHLVRAYHQTYRMPVTLTNCSNNYGPYQFPEKLIPLMILNARDYQSLPVYGDGRYVRDWLYVKDHCKAIWSVMKNGKRGETYTIGGKNEMENIRVVELICDILDELDYQKNHGSRRKLITHVKDRPGHDRRYAIDFTKIRKELGWIPEETFETGIRKTISWYIHNPQWVHRVKSGEYRTWIQEHYRQDLKL
ncbi:MAG: dTDP-glucose 4,6-dehydratase [Thermodesulfobacteriota bacterium]